MLPRPLNLLELGPHSLLLRVQLGLELLHLLVFESLLPGVLLSEWGLGFLGIKIEEGSYVE